MKIRLFAALMIALLMIPLSGCALDARVDALEESIDRKLDAAEAAVLEALAPAPEMPAPAEAPAAPEVPAYDPPAAEAPAELLEQAQAEAIALAHAGLTADEVSYLRTELDHDDGRREYEIEFRLDRWEYDYEIHAETGEILSWDKDWDD